MGSLHSLEKESIASNYHITRPKLQNITKKPFYLIALSLLLYGATNIYFSKNTCSIENNETKAVEDFFDLDINGCLQRVLIQSSDTENNPILLYLHGGPGSSLMMYSYLYADKLKDNFIFVNWDMRGAALSFHEEMDTNKVSEGQIAEDALYLINYLLKTYHKKKIYLLGHSFGSALGMYLVDKHPELFYAYVGVGQVIDYKKSVLLTYKWLHDTLEKADDKEALARIEKDNFPYIDLVIKYGGHHRLSLNLDSLVQNSPYYFDGYLDLRKKGIIFSQYHVGRNPKTFSAPSQITETSVPLYFFEGRNDHVIACSPELVEEYCQTVKAPIKKIIWFEKSAHYINVEEPDKFQDELIKILAENR